MATNDQGSCPNCGADFNGGSIWQTGYDRALKGLHYEQKGIPTHRKEYAEELADKYAEAYGATRTIGQWGRQIGIYDMEKDRTVSWKCPDCEYEWPRKNKP